MYRSLFLAMAILFLCVSASHAQAAGASAAPSVFLDTPEQKEDWTKLPLNKSGLDLTAINGVVYGKSEKPEFTSEVVRVQWRGGDPIDLYVVRPHGVSKPPVILFLYDYLSDTDRFRNEAWCKRVVERGFAAVGFVSALTGQRYSTRPMREWFVSELQESLGSSTHDVQMIISYLASRGDIDTTRVGMLGENSGATIAILAAAADPRIKFVDAINPWGDWPDWLKESKVIPEPERAAYLKPEFLEKVAMLDPIKYLPQLGGRVRIEQVATDPMTPGDVQAKIAASMASSNDVMHYADVESLVKVWMTQDWWLKKKLCAACEETAQSMSSTPHEEPKTLPSASR
ncbi:alpha/beta hydrolase family protein [Silvibacterium acidisoli]|uniref:alpha/beta hydrolase family protein n=1 Tax=Acidobacteriaceae bacterium ZG23-2 TaxID=2883246 RepID=UPI00406CB73D